MIQALRHKIKAPMLLAFGALIGLSGCNMHREGALKSALSAWFQLGDTLVFESKPRCTIAIFRARTNDLGPSLPLGKSIAEAQDIYRLVGRAGIWVEGASPHDITDAMLLNEDGAFGRQALAAVALAEPCLDPDTSRSFGDAMVRKGALLVYSAELEGVMVLDPEARKLFFVASTPI